MNINKQDIEKAQQAASARWGNWVNDTGWIVNPKKNLPLGTNVTVTISQKPVQPKQ